MAVVQLEEILFGCFESQSNWSIKDLERHTKQPKVTALELTVSVRCCGCQEFLRQVLNGLCVYVRRGPNKNTFQLKAEHGGPELVEEH